MFVGLFGHELELHFSPSLSSLGTNVFNFVCLMLIGQHIYLRNVNTDSTHNLPVKVKTVL